MKRLNILTATLAIFVSTAFAAPRDEEMKEYSVEVGQFTAIKLQDNVNVVYRCNPDSTGMVYYKGVEDFANAFIFSNNGKQLKIQVNTEDVGKVGMPTLYVYSDFLERVSNYSEYNITVENPAPCPIFTATLVGNGSVSVSGIKSTEVKGKITAGGGTITLEGNCGKATLQMTGAGVIQADQLKAGEVNCKIFGGGSIGCDPIRELIVKGIGSTKIYYRGEPQIHHKGGGKLIQI